MNFFTVQPGRAIGPLLIAMALLLLYGSIILNLAGQWWSDENYSHGLIVPFIAAFIIWEKFDDLRKRTGKPEFAIGLVIVFLGLSMLLFGTLGAELFTQRLSLIVVLAGVVIYFFGRRILFSLVVPFLLILLTIPIPGIIFNKIAFPLQLLATRVAHAGLLALGAMSHRNGNVIELITRDGTRAALEVVQACSGIRSLLALVTLALVFAYFGRDDHSMRNGPAIDFYKNPNLWRTLILMMAAFPIALITNASRLLLTGIATYLYGQQIIESWWHDAFGWLSFVLALLLLVATNFILKQSGVLRSEGQEFVSTDRAVPAPLTGNHGVALLTIVLLLAGGVLNWTQHRTPPYVERISLSEFPLRIDDAMRMGPDTKFGVATERILSADDYLMRDYLESPRTFNLYIGYYANHRNGATYHSPQNCLPGSGWEMSEGDIVRIKAANGSSFAANRFVVQKGDNRQIMIYWYQGRGRINASEYSDKIDAVKDSIISGRSDGAMVRVLTPVYSSETDFQALEAAESFAAGVYDVLPSFVPN